MNVNYKVSGEGRALILLHGWGGSINSLSGLQDILSQQGFEVYNLDLPGFGESKITAHALTFDEYVEYIYRFIKRLNLFKPIIVGHSFGGMLGCGIAIKYPDLLSNLVLVNASGINPKNNVKKGGLFVVSKLFGSIFSLPILKLIKPLVRKVFYKLVVRENDYLNSGNLQETLKNILKVHLDDQLNQITIDTFLIWSQNDTYTPLWMADKIQAAIKKSRLEIIADATHALPIKQPEIVAKLIVSYLRP